MPEQYDRGDLGPTESSLHLLGLNGTEPSPNEDESHLVRIVGGRKCEDGECPWQVTARSSAAGELGGGCPAGRPAHAGPQQT